jgi:hypothetical protein
VYLRLNSFNIPLAKHYFVNRADTPEISQSYLEKMVELQKNRGEELIKQAQLLREERA